MSALLGKNFRIYNANTFASSFARDSIYLYVGKIVSWADDTSPPAPEDTTQYYNSVYDKMAGMVRVNKNQVSLGIKRNNWTSGTKYGRYHHANTTLGSDFYVLAGHNDRDVYKCLDNNGYSKSTSKPTHKNLGVTRELDGYAWKYMYSISDTLFKRFATANVIPVRTDRDASSLSKSRTIIHLPIEANNTTGLGEYYRGLGFVNTTYSTSAVNATIATTVDANTSTNEVRVLADSGLALQANYYNNSAFYVTSGRAKGTFRRILLSKAGDRPADIDVGYNQDKSSNLVLSSSVTNFANGDTFIVGPIVTVNEKNIDGRGFLAIGKTNRYGNITSVDVSSVGYGYANGYANVTINGIYNPTSQTATITPDGSGADVELIIPPSGGGHGYHPSMELDAKYVIVVPETTIPSDHESGKFIGYGNDIRQIGLIRNPIDIYTSQQAYKQSYDLRTTLYFAHPTAVNFEVDQRVYTSLLEGEESASGLVFSVCGEGTYQYLSLVDVRGQFANGDIVYNRLGDSATISSASLIQHQYPVGSTITPKNSVINGSIAKYTGEILYHENISPITRRLDQKEEFKFVFEF